mmetsp:Transcript_20551/g.42228  ORF Transcript_20551/g.42228 Transcript_20551/m.42228 type:complete len:99 (+) Transcript_20551:1941-2237(+)
MANIQPSFDSNISVSVSYSDLVLNERSYCFFIASNESIFVSASFICVAKFHLIVGVLCRQCKLLEDGKASSMTPRRLEKLKHIGFPVWTKKSGLNKNS